MAILLRTPAELYATAETTVQQTTVMQQQAAVLLVPAVQAPITVLQVQVAVQTKAVRQAVPVP